MSSKSPKSKTSSARTRTRSQSRSKASPQWIWNGSDSPNSYVWFRRDFHLETAPVSAKLRITADSKYAAWTNGAYVGQGPAPFHPPEHFVDEYDITVHAGVNVVAVLGHWFGIPTHTYNLGPAGIWGEIELTFEGGVTQKIVTDADWRAETASSWLNLNRRRSWATGWTEDFDANLEPPAWRESTYDDSGWEHAVPHSRPGSKFLPRITRLLEEEFIPAKSVLLVATCSNDPTLPEKVNANVRMDDEPLKPAPKKLTETITAAVAQGKPFTVPADPGKGLAITLDLGLEWTGQIEFEIEAPAACYIEAVGAERLDKGRPRAAFKGADYAVRYTSREGAQTWRQFIYNGQRYLHFVFRSRPGAIRVNRIGLWKRQVAMDVKAGFQCSDPFWNKLYEISLQTVRVGSQELQVDCPTREQAPYFGDAVWTGLWAAWVTGEASLLKHLLFLGRTCQTPSGLLNGSPLTGLGGIHTMPDYSLIYVWGLSVYNDFTADHEEARAGLPSAERILNWFLKRLDKDARLNFDAAKAQAEGDGVTFLDHNGLGWHIQDEPGIDRRGSNALLHIFLVKALETYLKLNKTVKRTPKIKADAALVKKLRASIRTQFWNKELGLFADARVDGELSPSISEHTNCLAVLCDIVPAKEGREILQRVLDLDDRPVARCTPYFMIYFLEAMQHVGMRAEAVRLAAKRWKHMVDYGATTWWECFKGDHLDTFCHPWSSVPMWTAFSNILGVQPSGPGWKKIRISPLRSEFPEASGRVATPFGEIGISWKPRGKVKIDAPENLLKRIELE